MTPLPRASSSSNDHVAGALSLESFRGYGAVGEALHPRADDADTGGATAQSALPKAAVLFGAGRVRSDSLAVHARVEYVLA